jgi:flagellar protein FliJ
MGKRALGILIRLTRQHLDNQRVGLLALSEQIRRLELHIALLEKKIEEESRVSQSYPDYQQDFDFFRRRTQDRCFELAASKAELDKRFIDLQDKVIELFKQKKSYEMAQRLFFEKIRQQALVLEQKALDEIPNDIASLGLSLR